jgi:hypothetical protein
VERVARALRGEIGGVYRSQSSAGLRKSLVVVTVDGTLGSRRRSTAVDAHEEAVMEFVQVIEFETTKWDEMRAIGDEFRNARAQGNDPKPTSVMMVKDRDRPNAYRIVARFASYEEAMANSEREDTSEMAQRMAALCENQSFHNFDVVEEWTL